MRAIRKRSESKANPRSRKMYGLSRSAATFCASAIWSQAALVGRFLAGSAGDLAAKLVLGLGLAVHEAASRSPPRPPTRALRLFWMLKRSSFA